MTAKHPTFIISNGKGSSYLFRSVIPKDLRRLYNYPKELRLSLKAGIRKDAIRLAAILKTQLDEIFNGIRSGNITETCVGSIKKQLQQHLNNNSNSTNKSGNLTDRNSLRPLRYLSEYQSHQNGYYLPMKTPPELKLVRQYISKFNLNDIFAFCNKNNINYGDDTFPNNHIRRAREILIKLIDEEWGIDDYSESLSEKTLKIHLESMDYDSFRNFLGRFENANEGIEDLTKEFDTLDSDSLVEVISQFSDLTDFALELGIDVLFDDSNKRPREFDNHEKNIQNLWTKLKSNPDSDLTPAVTHEKTTIASPLTPTKNQNLESQPILSEIIKEYWDEKMATNAWGTKTALEIQTILNRMVEIIGDIPSKNLSYESARKYKSTLMKLPPNMSKDKRYRDLSIKEILELDNVKPISTITFNNNMGFVITMMNWAKKNGYVADNYFEGMKVKNPKKAKDQRKPFSDRNLKKIFNPETYLEETKGFDFRYWLPLLALFTGGRLGELTQLHKSDIVKKDGVFCIEITDERGTKADPKRLKNSSSERLVPISPQLIELGFLDYVQQQKKNKETTRLFPELTFTKADYYTRRCGRWFNQFYLRKKLGITDPQLSFHSFRHNVGNGLKQKKIQESFVSELLGHSSGNSMSYGRYGKEYRPKLLMEEIVKKISYKLDFMRLKKVFPDYEK